MTVSGSKSDCEVKVIRSSRSMVDRRHIKNRSVKRRISRSRGVLRGSGDSSMLSVNKIISWWV
jgi:hypothetical protein